MLGAYETPILRGRGGRRGSAMAPLERAMVVSLEQTRHVGVAKSEHPRLTNGEIILEESQPM